MLEFLTWLENSVLGETLRGSGIWTYGILNLFHILGLSTLFGAILVLDLRLLGLWRSIPMPLVARPTVPLAAIGFVVAICSGVSMLSVNATEYHGNPFMFYIKFPAIALGLVNVAVLSFLPAWRERNRRELSRREHRQLAVAGGISLLIWLTVVGAGRMVGYW